MLQIAPRHIVALARDLNRNGFPLSGYQQSVEASRPFEMECSLFRSLLFLLAGDDSSWGLKGIAQSFLYVAGPMRYKVGPIVFNGNARSF